MRVARRKALEWVPLAWGAALVLLSGAASKVRHGASPAKRARVEGPGDNDVITYVIDTDGSIYTRTQASDVDWGRPKLADNVLGQFRGMLEHWGPLIDEAGTDFRLPSSDIAGIMWAESNGNPSLTSKAGAVGLMQVMPIHFAESEKPRMFDPRTNIRKGAELLARARAGFRDLVQMASAYNAGGPTGPANGPWTNEAWLAAQRNPALTSRWGYAAEPGYIDRVVAANNTYIALKGGQA